MTPPSQVSSKKSPHSSMFPSIFPSMPSAFRATTPPQVPPSSYYASIPPIHPPSPLISGLRPNTTIKNPPAAQTKEYHTSDSEDDSSIESKHSESALIPPRTDYSRYSYWFKKNFSFLMTKPNMNFVENILEIKDYDTALKFKMFQPKDWKLFLGKYLFQRKSTPQMR